MSGAKGRKLGGLFSGVGGFERAWQLNGGEVAWLCEIDPAAQRVLRERFPGVPIYDDVSELDPTEVEAVDIVTGGSPCQGFSVAGGRKGMEHIESRLFADYVRIVDGLAARGLSYALWENVPGVLSITNDDGERTFPHVVAALVGASEPAGLDERVRWNSGMAARGRRAVSWRVLDSRHFGVPQRRRRVYACVALGGASERRAFGALLAKPEGVRGDSEACGQAGQVATPGALDGAAGTIGVTHGGDDLDRMTFVPAEVGTLTTAYGPKNYSNLQEVSSGSVIATSSASDVITSEGYTQPVTGRNGDPGSVLAPMLAATLTRGSSGKANAPGRRQEDDHNIAAVPIDMMRQSVRHNHPSGAGTPGTGIGKPGGPAYGLNAQRATQAVATQYGVRRLTPQECEALQAFPAGWTEPAGSDSARYRALGNAVTVNVPEWIMGRLE